MENWMYIDLSARNQFSKITRSMIKFAAGLSVHKERTHNIDKNNDC